MNGEKVRNTYNATGKIEFTAYADGLLDRMFKEVHTIGLLQVIGDQALEPLLSDLLSFVEREYEKISKCADIKDAAKKIKKDVPQKSEHIGAYDVAYGLVISRLDELRRNYLSDQ